eukprot:TRINITY_DN349_c0_g1_i1.p1 TRINITY_DN349_c0_g1~~TRINITY_DN349_c0_g1_i1.p1  ORF type:complete len:416 (+),score=164.27 TRINITY_DN349_c0_g1_i1:55-1248(+)
MAAIWHFLFAALAICQVVQSAPRVGLQIGIYPNSSQVVVDGVVQPDWSIDSATPALVEKYMPWLDLYMMIDASKVSPSDPVQKYSVSINSTSTIYILKMNQEQGELDGHKIMLLRAYFTCTASGINASTLIINVPGYDSLAISFRKECQVGQPRLGFMVGTVSWDDPSMSNLVGNVVADGTPLAKWGPSGTATVGTSVGSHAFYMWTTNGSQPFTVASVLCDETYLQARVYPVGATSGVARLAPTFPSTYFSIDYTCVPVPGAGTVSVSVVVSLNVNPFQPVSIMWKKQCINPDSDHSSWSPFGIFCFVLFLIITFGCISGCLFKYVRYGSRGWEVIPLWDYFVSAYNKCTGRDDAGWYTSHQNVTVGQSRVGPQASFDAPIEEPQAHNPFSSYQSI